MTRPCDVCQADTDAYLCRRCTAEVERALAELPADLTDLQAVATRQAAGPLGLGHGHYVELGRNGAPNVAIDAATDEPWVFAVGAADQLWVIGNTLSTWTRHLCETRGLEPPRASRGTWTERSWWTLRIERNRMRIDTHRQRVFVPSPDQPLADLSRWLLTNLDAIRLDEAAAQIHDEITGMRRENHRWIIGRGHPMFAGRCDAADVRADFQPDGTITPHVGVCGADLYGYLTERVVRCTTCGAEYDLAERKRWMLDQVDDQWATAHVIADALTNLDEPLNAATLRSWVARDSKLTHPVERPLVLAVGIDDDGRALYRVGDVRARVAWSVERRRAATAQAACA